MYKRVGIDPTKTRPSSEALLRRVRKGDDSCRASTRSWTSATGARSSSSLPYGLYDAAHIEGDVTLRLGCEGESYPGIRKDDVNVAGRMTLADANGPFGNPTSDSARTMVTTGTRRALLVVFAPRDLDPRRSLAPARWTRRSQRMQEFTGCREDARFVG